MSVSSFVLIISVFLVVSEAQFPQYPPQFDNPLQPPFNPQNLHPYRTGGYQLQQFPPPHKFNPFEHVYNEKGEKLSCKMVCSPIEETEEIDVKEKKDSAENKLEKKE